MRGTGRVNKSATMQDILKDTLEIKKSFSRWRKISTNPIVYQKILDEK